jgi:CelD/BcsL family acetyltransferase involved in cellulose biosynthesis
MMTEPFVTEAPNSGEVRSRLDGSLASEGLEIRVLDPTCDASWDRLVTTHHDFTFFHCSAWMRVLCKTYGHKPLALYCSRHRRPKVLLPLLEVASRLTGRRGVSLPFTDSCAPLVFDECDPAIVFENLHALARERSWKYFEIRGRLASHLPAAPSVTYLGHSLDLRAGPDVLFERFASPVKRAIRKAERSSLTVRLTASEEAIREFYRLHVRTRRRHGLPPQPFSFFRNIHREVIKPGFGFIVLANRGSTAVAAAVYLHMGSNAVYKFGASDEQYQDLRPNNLVMWHAIQHLARNDVEVLHLGRTSRENDGLRRFKLAWGTREEPLEYFRFGTKVNDRIAARDNVSGFHKMLFARLPLTLNQLMGAMLYPHLD